MVFTDLPLIQEFKTLGMEDYLWVQALFNHEELERLRGQEPTDPHQRFLWRIIRMGVIDLEAGEKAMDASTRSMRHSSAIGMRLWKMWREAEGFQGHSCPITSTERLYTVQVSTTRRSTKTKDSNNYLDTNIWDRRSNR